MQNRTPSEPEFSTSLKSMSLRGVTADAHRSTPTPPTRYDVANSCLGPSTNTLGTPPPISNQPPGHSSQPPRPLCRHTYNTPQTPKKNQKSAGGTGSAFWPGAGKKTLALRAGRGIVIAAEALGPCATVAKTRAACHRPCFCLLRAQWPVRQKKHWRCQGLFLVTF
jgi:hypothetical protein